MNHPSVRAAINRRVTGDPRKWPIAWLSDLVPDRLPFARAVSIGSGLGNFERTLIQLGIARSVTGVEESGEMVRRAGRSAAQAGLADRIAYVAGDAHEFLKDARELDVVFFHESLHHFARPQESLGLVRGALHSRGILYLDEYAGPSRDEWGWRDLWAWNAVYWRLPAVLRRTKIVRWPINRTDPTEAIASSRILPGVEEHFRVSRAGTTEGTCSPRSIRACAAPASREPRTLRSSIERSKRSSPARTCSFAGEAAITRSSWPSRRRSPRPRGRPARAGTPSGSGCPWSRRSRSRWQSTTAFRPRRARSS